MYCPKCGSSNVTVQIVQTGGKTRGPGCLFGLARFILVICTCGLWLLIGKRKSSTRFKNTTMAVCQECGYNWKVR